MTRDYRKLYEKKLQEIDLYRYQPKADIYINYF